MSFKGNEKSMERILPVLLNRKTRRNSRTTRAKGQAIQNRPTKQKKPLQGEARSKPFRCPLENKSSEIS